MPWLCFYSRQMSHTYKLTRMHADAYTNSVEAASAQIAAHPRYLHRLILSTRWFFRITRGAAAQTSSTCLSAGSATSPLDDVDEVVFRLLQFKVVVWLWLDGVAHTLYSIVQTWNWSHIRHTSSVANTRRGHDRGRNSTGSLSNNDRMLSISTLLLLINADSAAALYTIFTGPTACCHQSQSHRPTIKWVVRNIELISNTIWVQLLGGRERRY